MSEVKEKAQRWLDSKIDEESKKQIRDLLNDEEALTEAFYKDLEFGTGGLRGIMGMGSNRMNKYTIGMATQGLANYLIQTYPGEQIKAAIAHDSRNNSRFFAETTAAVFSANGIEVFLFEDLRPTPELSFAIRHLNCHTGVVLTASHNPKEYNGYKAYWNDGAQMVAPHDKNVIAEVNKIHSADEVKFDAKEDLIHNIGTEIDQLYLGEIKDLSLSPEIVQNQKNLKIVYSPIHGTGVTVVPQCLKQYGFENVYVVEEQSEPNGNFPTVVYPNPEEAEALKIALNKAREVDADLVMATDPDADRVGIAVKNLKGEFQLLNGNQTGSLLIYYILKRWTELSRYKGGEYIVKTIVTTELIKKIAERFNVDSYDTLTGFKYIASIIRENEGKRTFIAGGEESYGYLIGEFVRDKDAVASCAMIAEMCAYAASEGKTVYELLIEIYEECGFYKEKLISLTKKGKQGAEEIQQMMLNFRETPPESFGGSKVVKVVDYQNSTDTDLIAVKKTSIDFEKSNVLQFFTEDGSKISARPSGTEPKIKFYISVNKPLDSKDNYEKVEAELDSQIQSIESDLMSL
ncbi:phospho-sugar mutase [Fulvivirga sediminis]|uniref:Phospho-sugar mutase n=1 Tax=Fulvivirga sediminis TaxID=2803949 RepID=A0A937F652_9BACT|nr:phospho-sugar mutase [Fulvivirga sediminis]MBL3655364.1 phospho-sugar mutase [Fulvivirga sediminis]